MPELPEVESRRRIAERYLLGRTLARVSAADDRIVFHGVLPRTFARVVSGTQVTGVSRKGKILWLELDRRPWPVFHFGMGGTFHVYETAARRPAYWKVELVTSEGTRLAMTNPRRLGRVRLQEDPLREPPVSLLGPDPLDAMPPLGALAALLSRRAAPIKAALLDQGVLAGIGNWIADEILYQARLDPGRPARDLTRGEIRRLRARLGAVIRKAVAVDADSNRFPASWLFHHRWGKNPEARTARGERIAYRTIGGRTTAWVPEVQGGSPRTPRRRR